MAPIRVDLSILIPCYQEEKNIPELVARIRQVMEKEDLSWELILVDDGSLDGTWEEIRKSGELDPRIHGIRHPENRGIVGAWETALAIAKADRVLTIDADLQYAPEDVPKLVHEMYTSRCDLVQGIRLKRYEKPRYRILLSIVFSKILKIVFNMPFEDVKSGFILYKKDAFSEILKHRGQFRLFQHWIIVAAYNLGFQIHQLPITFYPRKAGKSFIRFPLRFATTAFLEVPRAFLYFRAVRRS